MKVIEINGLTVQGLVVRTRNADEARPSTARIGSLWAEFGQQIAPRLAPGALAYELAYGKGLTPFLRLAQNAGVQRLADGVGMLAEQAAEAFAWWRGIRPPTSEVIRQLTVPLD